MIVIPPDQYRFMPWKNGGGSTTEIAISPSGAGLDDFDWRVSMAGVAEPGPFSAFPGVDRTLSVLEGNGIVLDIQDRAVTLAWDSPPLQFPADVRVHGAPVDGPIVDLNVMTRRGRYRHGVLHLTAMDEMDVWCCGVTNLILSIGEVRMTADGVSLDLPAGAAVRLDEAAGPLVLACDGAIEIFLIEIFAA
jgi:environmental stress-induced protein Ves